MELNSDLIAIQGLLSSVIKTTGDFTNIRYKGGNEMKINQVIKELDDYLTSKQYLNKRISNKVYYNQLEDITFFLILNLDYKDEVLKSIKEYAHLINIIPTLSKCLLANIVVELDLNEFYCNALHKLPIELSEELLSEIIPCIKKSNPETSLELTYLYMKNIIAKIGCIDTSNNRISEYVDKLEGVSSKILLNCSGINPDQMHDWRKLHIYKHMGQTLLCLLKLLLHCQVENEVLYKIIDDLINSICSIMIAVTVDVFCAWAEIEYKNEPLQAVVAVEAYYIIEKYQKYEPAKPLIQMIGSIAKKPKSVNEMIQEANNATMILRIEQNPIDRKKWFTALLNTQVFQSKESKECISRWANLCTLEDIGRLLNLSVNHKNEEDVVEIIIKCTSFFSETDIVLIMTRFFHQHGLKNCLKSKNTVPQLTITLNKLEKKGFNEPIKDILLLLLQDPTVVLDVLYRECIKSSILLESLKDTFLCIGHIIEIENLFISTLQKNIEDNRINSNNIGNYEILFKIIAETNYKKLIHNFLLPCVQKNLTDLDYDSLHHMFHIYKVTVNNTFSEELDILIQTSINILEKCRWKIFDFTNLKATVCSEAVQVLLDAKDQHFSDITETNISSLQHVVNKYYMVQLKNRQELDLLNFVCPHLNTEKHAESVGHLIKLLPICVPKEWILLASTIMKKCECIKMLEILTDALTIVSQVVKTQAEKDNGCLSNGLRFCIQNYGLILKDMLLPLENEEINAVLVKCICRLLREVPSDLINIEGMSLISLIPDKTLKMLTHDEDFISILLSMNGSETSRIIAKRMVE